MSILPENQTGTWRTWKLSSPAHLPKGQTKKPSTPSHGFWGTGGWRKKDQTSWRELDRFELFVGRVRAKAQPAGTERLFL